MLGFSGRFMGRVYGMPQTAFGVVEERRIRVERSSGGAFAALRASAPRAGRSVGFHAREHHVAIDEALRDVERAEGKLVHHVEEDLLHDGAQAASAGAAAGSPGPPMASSASSENSSSTRRTRKKPVVLLDERVLRLREDVDERLLVEGCARW